MTAPEQATGPQAWGAVPQPSNAPRTDGYLAISEYGIVGDGHTAALVGLDGAIDWCCFPRFDAPSVFARILDASKGGHCRISPLGPHCSRQRYLPGTNVLVTEFETSDGAVIELTDFMPVNEGGDCLLYTSPSPRDS